MSGASTKGVRVVVNVPEFPGSPGTVTRPVERMHGLDVVHVAVDSRPDVPGGLPFVARWVRVAGGSR